MRCLPEINYFTVYCLLFVTVCSDKNLWNTLLLDDLGNRFGDGAKVAVVFLSKSHICLEILHFTSHLKYDIFSKW